MRKKRNSRGPGRRRLLFIDLVEPALEGKLLRGGRETSVEKDRAWWNVLAPIMAHWPVREITPAKITRLLENLARGDKRHGPRSGATVNRYHSFISSVFLDATRRGTIKKNPTGGEEIAWSKETEIHVRYLLNAEEDRLFPILWNEDPRHALEMVLAISTGCRRGEQWDLEWKDVDLEARVAHVTGKVGAREVHLNDIAIETLGRLRSLAPADRYVSEGRDRGAVDRRTWFAAAVRAAGIKRFKWRDLRHTFASRLALAGVPLLDIQRLMGHKSSQTTLKYAHLSDQALRSSVEKMEMGANYSETRTVKNALNEPETRGLGESNSPKDSVGDIEITPTQSETRGLGASRNEAREKAQAEYTPPSPRSQRGA